MLVSLLIMIVFVMHGVIETETIDIAWGAGGDDVGIVEWDNELLDEVWEGEEVQGLVVDGVIDEDVLFLVDCEEVAPVAVFDDFAVGNLNVFQDLDLVVDNGEDFETGWEADCEEQAAWVHGHG